MGWFSSAPVSPAAPSTNLAPPSNLATDLKPAGQAAEKVKPCCVCKEEKASRDECMLFSRSDNPQDDCKDIVGKYKDCMKGYGFKI